MILDLALGGILEEKYSGQAWILANESPELLSNWLGFSGRFLWIRLSFANNILVGSCAVVYVEAFCQDSILEILNDTLTFGDSAHLAKNNV